MVLGLTALVLGACSAPTAPPPQAHVSAVPAPLPPVPWRDSGSVPNITGIERWTDSGRDRAIVAQWTAPRDGARALLLILPGLAQGTSAPPALVDTLVDAGFAVLTVGHPGNDAAVWQSPEARRADFKLAARRMYATTEVTDRADDVRFVLDSMARQPPSWLPADAKQRIGIIGIGLGAQTVQLLLGEKMARDSAAVGERRIAAAVLIAPYVGFEGPAMHQRYGGISTPLLIAYGQTETDPNGLGMTAQQRRAMVDALTGARVVEVRLPAAALTSMQALWVGAPSTTEPRALPPIIKQENPTQGGRPQKGGPTVTMQSAGAGGPDAMFGAPGQGAAGARNEQLARVALIFSVSAFFESELLRSADARDWLEGPHPGPVQWAVLPAGRIERPGASR
jgi:alpha-beta hydrolase superfamily lysophospholipase